MFRSLFPIRSSNPIMYSCFVALATMANSSLRAQDIKSIVPPVADGAIRVATFNVSFHREAAGELIENLKAGDEQIAKITKIIRAVSPDVLLVNEIDYDQEGLSAKLFLEKYLQSSDFDSIVPETKFQYHFTDAVNTGVPSGLDMNQNGKLDEPDDAWGFGRYPGQYGMAVYSRFPIAEKEVRTFRKFKWRDMPGALRPRDPAKDADFYPDELWEKLYLSSKSHWDVPIDTPFGRFHFLASHPTPPVFDGPEDRNGCRNHDEIRLWCDYIENGEQAAYIYDDSGKRGGLDPQAAFVLAGDLNSDPNDGSGRSEGIRRLLGMPRVVASPIPESPGGVEAAEKQGLANKTHQGPPAQDTADFNDRSPGNLRCDFVLPSNQFEIVQCGIFWPTEEHGKEWQDWVEATDHRLVWIDIRWKQ